MYVKRVSFGVLTADVRKLKSSAFICRGYVLVVILLSIYFCTDVAMMIQKLQRIAAEIFRHTVVVTAMVKMAP
jgi:hypothetical protein